MVFETGDKIIRRRPPAAAAAAASVAAVEGISYEEEGEGSG